jgi:hypothetical protein
MSYYTRKMETEVKDTFNKRMVRDLDNRDATLSEVLLLSEIEGYELLFKHFGHIDGNVLSDLKRIGKTWGSMRLQSVSGTDMRWQLQEKSKCKCSSNWYNILGMCLSYSVLVWQNPQRWIP